MSSTVTVQPAKGVRGIGMFSIIAGFVLIIAGIVVWIVVSMTLSSEEITVSDDASMFAGQHVAGPFTAYAQADVIDMHATEMADGKTYAELDQDDPIRESVMDASFLRASLFTSVVAFGVCALVIGLGIMFLLIGGALRRLAGGPSVAVETAGLSSEGALSTAPRHAGAAAPVAPAEPPVAPVAPAATPPERTSSLRPAPAEEVVAPVVEERPADVASPGSTAPEAVDPVVEERPADVASPGSTAPEAVDPVVEERPADAASPGTTAGEGITPDEPTDPDTPPRV